MKKTCPRCGAKFECRHGEVTECHCAGVKLSAARRKFIADNYSDCLCGGCLREMAMRACLNYDNVYFLGIGGIGMSALARYFMSEGRNVAGYDRTRTPLTDALTSEGAAVHYDDDPALIPSAFRDTERTIVVYTPALPADSAETRWFRERGFRVVKRSQMLDTLSEGKYVMAVAGTHGKTTTTTMTAWLNHATTGGGSAFLGGISKNFDSNLILGGGDRLAVEADEYDRSFLRLHPDVAVVTATDADHLDIYGTVEELRAAFAQFTRQIKAGGALILKRGARLDVDNREIKVYSYDYRADADFHARAVEMRPDGTCRFDAVCPDRVVEGCELGVPGWVNVENAIAAIAMVWVAARHEGTPLNEQKLREGLRGFRGVRRRFDFHVLGDTVYMDDYAHHPEELRAAITSLREIYPERTMRVAFQPHLYTRTKDFHREFAESLSLADEVILTPIYPAREEPIEGVDSELIASLVTAAHRIVPLGELPQALTAPGADLLVTFGAGDIETTVGEVARRVREGRS